MPHLKLPEQNWAGSGTASQISQQNEAKWSPRTKIMFFFLTLPPLLFAELEGFLGKYGGERSAVEQLFPPLL